MITWENIRQHIFMKKEKDNKSICFKKLYVVPN